MLILGIFNTWHVHYLFVYILYNCYFIVCSHFNLHIRLVSRLRDAAFEMQLSFHVWSSWIRYPSFVCNKTVFIKYIHVNTTQPVSFFNPHLTCFYVFLKHTKLKWRSHITARLQWFRIAQNHTPKNLASSMREKSVIVNIGTSYSDRHDMAN